MVYFFNSHRFFVLDNIHHRIIIVLLMVFRKNALMCIKNKKAKLINHDCLPTFMLLYIMLAY